jgi:hypothetical protein
VSKRSLTRCLDLVNLPPGRTKSKYCFKERFPKVVYLVTVLLRSKMLLAKERLVNNNFLRIAMLLRP